MFQRWINGFIIATIVKDLSKQASSIGGSIHSKPFNRNVMIFLLNIQRNRTCDTANIRLLPRNDGTKYIHVLQHKRSSRLSIIFNIRTGMNVPLIRMQATNCVVTDNTANIRVSVSITSDFDIMEFSTRDIGIALTHNGTDIRPLKIRIADLDIMDIAVKYS